MCSPEGALSRHLGLGQWIIQQFCKDKILIQNAFQMQWWVGWIWGAPLFEMGVTAAEGKQQGLGVEHHQLDRWQLESVIAPKTNLTSRTSNTGLEETLPLMVILYIIRVWNDFWASGLRNPCRSMFSGYTLQYIHSVTLATLFLRTARGAWGAPSPACKKVGWMPCYLPDSFGPLEVLHSLWGYAEQQGQHTLIPGHWTWWGVKLEAVWSWGAVNRASGTLCAKLVVSSKGEREEGVRWAEQEGEGSANPLGSQEWLQHEVEVRGKREAAMLRNVDSPFQLSFLVKKKLWSCLCGFLQFSSVMSKIISAKHTVT